MRGQGKLMGVLVAAVLISQASAARAAASAGRGLAQTSPRRREDAVGQRARERRRHVLPQVVAARRARGARSRCGTWTLSNKWANKLKGLWNNIFSSQEWATWGARGISVDWEEGQINAGFKRTFFGAGLAASKTTVEVVKEGGEAAATITTCELDYEGRVTAKQQKTFAGGTGGEGTVVKIVLTHTDNRILGIVVDTDNAIPGVTFEYRARTISQPIRTDFGEVEGLADLHAHQMVNITFGGRMYWGHHSGPPKTALAKEEVNPSGTGYDLTTLEGLLQQMRRTPSSPRRQHCVRHRRRQDQRRGLLEVRRRGLPQLQGLAAPRRPLAPGGAHLLGQGGPRARQGHQAEVEPAAHGGVAGQQRHLVQRRQAHRSLRQRAHPRLGGKITGWESATWGCTDHENVVRQMQAMHQIEKEHKWYRIAMHPWHARQIIEDGDLAVVISMETDKPLSVAGGNKDGDWEKQLDFYRAMGLSTMQIVHESDSIFCGAAPHRDMMGALQVIHWPLKTITELFDGNKSNFDRDANGKNKLGLTPRGKLLVEAMKKRNMPIDLAHGSERCREDVMAQVGTDYGLYDSHTKFGALLGGHVKAREEEFVVTDEMARAYEKHKVLVGLRTSSTDANDATNDVSPAKHVPNNCAGSARSYAQQLAYALKFPKLAIAYGTDYNTGVAQMGPRFGTGRCFASRKDLKDTVTRPMSDSEGTEPARMKTVQPIAGTNYYTHGLATYGWLPDSPST